MHSNRPRCFHWAIEVKTDISSSKQFLDAIIAQAELREKTRHRGLHAIYAWDAISYNKAIETLWDFVRQAPTKNFDSMPDVMCIRGKYLLMANRDGDRQSPPYQVWHVNKGGITEGQALLGLVASVWKFGLQLVFPWWLSSWHDNVGMLPEKAQSVSWPEDLRVSVVSDIKT